MIVAPVLMDVSQDLNSAPCKKPNKNIMSGQSCHICPYGMGLESSVGDLLTAACFIQTQTSSLSPAP